MRQRIVAFFGSALILASALFVSATELSAQGKDGSGRAALGGAVLGASSGAVLGLIGGAGVCSRLLEGARCPRVAAALGGAVGALSGAVLGAEDSGALDTRLENAGYGALIGGIVGIGLTRGVRQYRWPEVGTFLVVGGAIGSSPSGAGWGFGVGAIAGTAGWLIFPELKIGDAVSLALFGLAAGGLADWIAGNTGGNKEELPFMLPVQVRF